MGNFISCFRELRRNSVHGGEVLVRNQTDTETSCTELISQQGESLESRSTVYWRYAGYESDDSIPFVPVKMKFYESIDFEPPHQGTSMEGMMDGKSSMLETCRGVLR